MWTIHSYIISYITLRNKLFTSYTSHDFGVLKIDNDGMSKVVRVGDVCLQTNMRVYFLLKRVKHVLGVHFNLICLMILVVIITLILVNGNSLKVTWLCLVGRKILNCIGL